jgi:hypothetical protein
MRRKKLPCAFCENNSTETGQIDLPGGTYVIPSCEEHVEAAIEMRIALEEGAALAGYPVKRFFKLVESDLEEEEEKEETATTASSSWRFTDRVGHWNMPDGSEVKIDDMKKGDLAIAVWAIIKANFQRKSAKLAWATNLVPDKHVPNAYPKKGLSVGQKKAYEKLEDFCEVAERKKWS